MPRPHRRAARADARPLAAIAVPAVLANIATPFGNAIVTAAIARYGDSAVAGYAVIGRIVPLAFGAIFALAGSIGPILGQNFGAGRFDRVRGTVRDGMIFTTLYCVAMCVALLLLREPIVRAFGASGEGADLIRFFCMYLSWSWIAVGWLFVANAAFNNLGFPTWSTVFNWGRATVGTVPFVWIGATQFGAAGVIAGQGAGGVAFAIGAVVVCFMVIGKLAAHPVARPGRRGRDGRGSPAVLLREGRDRDRLGRAGRETEIKSARRRGRRARVPDLRGDEEVRSGWADGGGSARPSFDCVTLSRQPAQFTETCFGSVGTIEGASNTLVESPVAVRRRLTRRSCARLTRIGGRIAPYRLRIGVANIPAGQADIGEHAIIEAGKHRGVTAIFDGLDERAQAGRDDSRDGVAPSA